MAIQSQPSRIPQPFAGSGTKNTIPATNATPSASQAASWASGFPPECSQPISAGGCPVPRNDVNGALNQLSQDFAFRQDGGIWAWSALADYDAQRIVRGADGTLYWSVQQSGPGFASGAVDPTADDGTYWVAPPVRTMPYGDTSNAVASTEWCNGWFNNTITLPDNLFVDPAGDDANNGFSATTPKKTIGATLDMIRSNNYICPSYITVNLAPGSYSEFIEGTVKTQIGYTSQNGTARITNGAYIANNSRVILYGDFMFDDGLDIGYYGQLQLGDLCSVSFNSVTPTNTAFFYVYNGGGFFCKSGDTASISFSGSCNGTVLQVGYSGLVSIYGTLSWSGSVTGQAYSVYGNSTVRGIGSSSIPGTIAGTCSSESYFS